MRSRTSGGSVMTQSSTPGGWEANGITINPGGPYSAIYGLHTAYSASTIALPADRVLWAPALYMAGGACLETGTLYTNPGGTGVTADFYVYDWCAGTANPLVFVAAIDDTFLATYVRMYPPSNLPMYATEVYTGSALPFDANTNWDALLYNYATSAYEVVFSRSGLATLGYGWSEHQFSHQPGQCPQSLPALRAESVQMYNYGGGYFEPLAPAMTGKTTSVDAPSSCFTGDTTGPASYVFDLQLPNHTWEVRSTGF
jgi:hypothetical protein